MTRPHKRKDTKGLPGRNAKPREMGFRGSGLCVRCCCRNFLTDDSTERGEEARAGGQRGAPKRQRQNRPPWTSLGDRRSSPRAAHVVPITVPSKASPAPRRRPTPWPGGDAPKSARRRRRTERLLSSGMVPMPSPRRREGDPSAAAAASAPRTAPAASSPRSRRRAEGGSWGSGVRAAASVAWSRRPRAPCSGGRRGGGGAVEVCARIFQAPRCRVQPSSELPAGGGGGARGRVGRRRSVNLVRYALSPTSESQVTGWSPGGELRAQRSRWRGNCQRPELGRRAEPAVVLPGQRADVLALPAVRHRRQDHAAHALGAEALARLGGVLCGGGRHLARRRGRSGSSNAAEASRVR